MMTLVSMLWPGPRGYTLAHAEAVAAAVARHATFPYRFVVLTDEPPGAESTVEVQPFPAAAQPLTVVHPLSASVYPTCLAKLWLFSAEAVALGPTILYLDADSLICGDLAPLVAYQPQAPFVWMANHGKLVSAMFRLATGTLTDVWTRFVAEGAPRVAAGSFFTDQTWLRRMGLATRNPCWPSEQLGLYVLKDLDGAGPISALPADARVVQPTGKTKPWEARFLQRYPWAQEHYLWAR